MSLSDWVPICDLKYGLQLFQALRMYCIFAVEVTMISKGILVNKMGLEKVKYLIFHI